RTAPAARSRRRSPRGWRMALPWPRPRDGRTPGCRMRCAPPIACGWARATARSIISTGSGPMAEITVVGAGVAGLCVATELADRGLAPRLVDRVAQPGPHACSWWAGGMLAPLCEGESAEEPVLRLGGEALGWWQRHTGVVSRQGTLVLALARDRRELERCARRTAGHRRLDAAALAAIEPDLAGRAADALFFEEEAHLDPRAALAGLVDGLARRGIRIEPAGDELPGHGLVIDCRGLEARDALPDLRGVKGEMIVLRSAELSLARPVRLLHPRYPLYIVPRGDGV